MKVFWTIPIQQGKIIQFQLIEGKIEKEYEYFIDVLWKDGQRGTVSKYNPQLMYGNN